MQFSAFVPFLQATGECERAAFVPAVASAWWGKPHPTTMVYIQGSGVGVCIAIHRKPHTVLRCLAVQPRTVFDNAPCLKLSVDGYIWEVWHGWRFCIGGVNA